MARKIFLDIGAHNGSSTKGFRERYDRNAEYEIYAFECDPSFTQTLEEIEDPQENITIFMVAVWDRDGHTKFYQGGTRLKDGGTMYREKTTGAVDRDHPKSVLCIDLAAWIKRHFEKEDTIIMKMNVEGAEYRILPKMIENGTIDYIDLLLIQWHWWKVGVSEDEHRALSIELIRRGIQMGKWRGFTKDINSKLEKI